MTEQQFINIAIEELFGHYMAQIICIENYNDLAYTKAYVRLFDIYSALVEEYNKNHIFQGSENTELLEIKCRLLFRRRREKMIEIFLETLQKAIPGLDIIETAKKFYQKLDNQNVVTMADQILLYSYILNEIRQHEENNTNKKG